MSRCQRHVYMLLGGCVCRFEQSVFVRKLKGVSFLRKLGCEETFADQRIAGRVDSVDGGEISCLEKCADARVKTNQRGCR